MTKTEIKQRWGSFLWKRLSPWIDNEGYIEKDFAQLVDDNFSNWDSDYNDTNENKEIFSRMYNLDFEDHPTDNNLMRPV